MDGESATSSPSTQAQPNRKARVALACKRCKKRKQRVSTPSLHPIDRKREREKGKGAGRLMRAYA